MQCCFAPFSLCFGTICFLNASVGGCGPLLAACWLLFMLDALLLNDLVGSPAVSISLAPSLSVCIFCQRLAWVSCSTCAFGAHSERQSIILSLRCSVNPPVSSRLLLIFTTGLLFAHNLFIHIYNAFAPLYVPASKQLVAVLFQDM